MDLATVLSSGVVAGLIAGLIAGLVTLRTSERKIAIENITQQRQLWREKIRNIALRIKTSHQESDKIGLHSQYIELQLLLNPSDSDDKSILDTVWKMIESKNSEGGYHVELGEKLSLLLKHDWERAKREAKPIWFRVRPVKRISYENFANKRNGS